MNRRVVVGGTISINCLVVVCRQVQVQVQVQLLHVLLQFVYVLDYGNLLQILL